MKYKLVKRLFLDTWIERGTILTEKDLEKFKDIVFSLVRDGFMEVIEESPKKEVKKSVESKPKEEKKSEPKKVEVKKEPVKEEKPTTTSTDKQPGKKGAKKKASK